MKLLNHSYVYAIGALVLSGLLGSTSGAQSLTTKELAVRLGRVLPQSLLEPGESHAEEVQILWHTLNTLGPRSEHRVTLSVSSTERITLVLESCEVRSSESYTWFGRIAGASGSDVILVRHADAIRLIARDYRPGGNFYQIRGTQPGTHVMTLRSRHVIPDCQPNLQASQRLEDTAGRGGAGLSPLVGSGDDPEDLIDIMILGSNQVLFSFGETIFVALAYALIADLNLRLSTSGSPLRARLCAAPVDLISYSESGNINTDLNRLGYQMGDHTKTEDLDPTGAMDEVHTRRDEFRPDLIALLTFGGGTGLAFRLDSAQGDIGSGYSVSNVGLALSNGTFSHEIGHNLGLRHNIENNPSLTGVAPYAHGIARICGSVIPLEELITTMSYHVTTTLPSTRVARFSVTGLHGSVVDPIFGALCTVNLWDPVTARSVDAINLSRAAIADYNIGSSQIWADVAGSGGQGTWQEPVGTILQASQLVSGPAGVAVIRARTGTYSEVAANGGAPVVLTKGTIVTEGGGVVLQ